MKENEPESILEGICEMIANGYGRDIFSMKIEEYVNKELLEKLEKCRSNINITEKERSDLIEAEDILIADVKEHSLQKGITFGARLIIEILTGKKIQAEC